MFSFYRQTPLIAHGHPLLNPRNHNLVSISVIFSFRERLYQWDDSLCDLLGSCHPAFQNDGTILFSLQKCTSDPVCLHHLRHLVWSLFFTLAILIGVEWYCGFNLHFPNGWWCWICYVFTSHQYILFREISFYGFCSFSSCPIFFLQASLRILL